jgi:DNA invertase Pin-like site-specific DNA recombinase
VELIAYYRVSTARKDYSGLGLEAQRSKLQQLAADRGAVVVAEFVEVESGRKAERLQLAVAMAEARKRGAVMGVAKLDRLARDAELVLRLAREADRNGFGGLLFADQPEVDATTAAGRMVLTVMASVAEYEGRRIAERTREALAAAKARGVKLGGSRPGTLKENAKAKAAAAGRSEALRPILAAMAAQGASLRAMAGALAAAGTRTAGRPTLEPYASPPASGAPGAGSHWELMPCRLSADLQGLPWWIFRISPSKPCPLLVSRFVGVSVDAAD